jgi:polygalacturonase
MVGGAFLAALAVQSSVTAASLSPARPTAAKIDSDVPECWITAKIYGGGAVGDNATVSTKAIQSAIDGCHANYPGGSRVVVPAGSFKTGSLMLRSNLELHLAAGAGLYGSDDWSAYPLVRGLPFGTMFRALISGYNRECCLPPPRAPADLELTGPTPTTAAACCCALLLHVRACPQ